jgi:hypothetical protein
MSALVTDEIKKLAALSGVREGVILQLRSTWNNCDMHKMIRALFQQEIETVRASLETCKEIEFRENQGRIKGLRQAIAILNKQHD